MISTTSRPTSGAGEPRQGRERREFRTQACRNPTLRPDLARNHSRSVRSRPFAASRHRRVAERAAKVQVRGGVCTQLYIRKVTGAALAGPELAHQAQDRPAPSRRCRRRRDAGWPALPGQLHTLRQGPALPLNSRWEGVSARAKASSLAVVPPAGRPASTAHTSHNPWSEHIDPRDSICAPSPPSGGDRRMAGTAAAQCGYAFPKFCGILVPAGGVR